MSIFINERKIKAAARSMHQYCEPMRQVFRRPVGDDVIEACTMHLYLSIASDLFSKRFAERMAEELRNGLKYCSMTDMRDHLARLRQEAATFAQQSDSTISGKLSEGSYQQRVRSVIKAMFALADHPIYDEEVSDAFMRFEKMSGRIRDHLMGIKKQNAMLMR